MCTIYLTPMGRGTRYRELRSVHTSGESTPINLSHTSTAESRSPRQQSAALTCFVFCSNVLHAAD
jgi:hypothetical protein